MVRTQFATRWEANQPAVSRARTSRTAAVENVVCTLDFGLGLGTGAHKPRMASPSIPARPPEEFLP